MCGIYGIAGLDDGGPVEEAALRAMSATLRHRGPDGGGVHIDGASGIGMRRLRVIDLETGDQPMANEDGSVWVVFNGEIYNYRELRQELQSRGHRFSTASDTEVIVHAYEELGDDCVQRLRGMFAFAVWDKRRMRMLVARDRIGIKPLYYVVDRGRLIFGSELKALLAARSDPAEIDPAGLVAYLQYAYIADPLSILKGIAKLPAGHRLTVQNGRVAVERYWDVRSFLATASTDGRAPVGIEEIGVMLEDAVRQHLVSDVPVGAFLSGGLDSSTVVAMMTAALDRPVRTFSVGFDDPKFNELPYARRVAQHLGTEHHELLIEPTSVDILEKVVWHFDEPFADPSALPTYLLSELARQHVTVVLSGDGGDEVFAGYDHYVRYLARGFADRVPGPVKRHVLRPLSAWLPEGTPGKRFLHNVSLPSDERYLDSITYCSPSLLDRLLGRGVLGAAGISRDIYRGRLGRFDGFDTLSRLQALDFETYLPGDILVKVDRMTMAHSLEARVPLLDHEVVQRLLPLPSSAKLRGGIRKYLFREVARRYLPADIVDRGKHGFAVPLGRWFREELNTFLRDVLSDPRTEQRSYLERKELRRLVAADARRRDPIRLWMLAILELWHRTVLESPFGSLDRLRRVQSG